VKDYTGPVIGDAFGAALDAYWRGTKDAQLLIERDDGFIERNLPSLYFAPPDELDEWDAWALERATGRVLDVGCGPGRHMAVLQARGFDVTGVDPSALLVGICHERGLVAVGGALPELPMDLGTFDTLLLLGNNLGLLGSREEAQEVLAGLAAVASPAAQILATTVDPCPDSCASEHHPYHEANTAAGRLPGHLMLRARYRNLADPWFDYLLIAPRDLEELLTDGPWRLADYHGSEGRYAVRLMRR
jgi:SAM-dependent methyltransferase